MYIVKIAGAQLSGKAFVDIQYSSMIQYHDIAGALGSEYCSVIFLIDSKPDIFQALRVSTISTNAGNFASVG
jgi:hypothetical protein